MNKRLMALAALLICLLAAGCGSSKKNGSGASPGAAVIAIKNFKFSMPALTVKAGTRVTWTNDDSAPHTATAGGTPGFDTGTLQKGASKSIVLTKAGSYSYVCAFHPFMKGTITVTQ